MLKYQRHTISVCTRVFGYINWFYYIFICRFEGLLFTTLVLSCKSLAMQLQYQQYSSSIIDLLFFLRIKTRKLNIWHMYECFKECIQYLLWIVWKIIKNIHILGKISLKLPIKYHILYNFNIYINTSNNFKYYFLKDFQI